MEKGAAHLWVKTEDISEKGWEIHTKESPRFLDIDSCGDIFLKENICIDCFLQKLGHRIYLKGSVVGQIDSKCSRCLEWFTTDVQSELNGTYFPDSMSKRYQKDEVVEIREEDINVYYYSGEKIDLFPLLRDHILLSIPMKPLCKDDCAGLCPICGTNNNFKTCDCASEYIDSRLEGLEKLKEKLKKENYAGTKEKTV